MNYKQKLVLPICAALLLYGCNSADDSNQSDNDAEEMTTVGQGTETGVDPQVKAEVKDVEGKTLGTVNFTAEENTVVIETALEGLGKAIMDSMSTKTQYVSRMLRKARSLQREDTLIQLMTRTLNMQGICPLYM